MWEYAYSFEALVQFMGRLARVQGQSGICSFITWDDAISQHCRGDNKSKEVAAALRNESPFDNIVYGTIDTDPARVSVSFAERPQPVHTLSALRLTVRGVQWYVCLLSCAQIFTQYRCQNRVQTAVGCIICGHKAGHGSRSCPRLYGRCFQCGDKGHSRSTCTRSLQSKHAIHSRVYNRYICRRQEEFQVPEMFCCKCLLPLWPLFEDVQVHDGSCGASCKHNLGDYGKMLFAMARDRSLPKLALLIPQGSHEDVWKWMFTSRIPGILQLFGGLMETP